MTIESFRLSHSKAEEFIAFRNRFFLAGRVLHSPQRLTKYEAGHKEELMSDIDKAFARTRRTLALLLLVLIGLPLVIPLLLADDRPELPACCRRNGKYHCATSVMNAAPFPAAQTFGAFQLKCPFFPKPGGLPTYSKAAMFVLGWQVVPVSPLRVQLEYPNYPFQKRRLAMPSKKRGPPPVFS